MLVPAEGGVTGWEPLVDCGPDQSTSLGLAEAEQEVAFVLDQLSATDWPSVTVFDDATIVIVGAFGGGGGGGAALPPQPFSNPAPQRATTNPKIFCIAPTHGPQSDTISLLAESGPYR